jgi:hypothetical protein
MPNQLAFFLHYFEIVSLYIAMAAFADLEIFLPQPSECWHLINFFLFLRQQLGLNS